VNKKEPLPRHWSGRYPLYSTKMYHIPLLILRLGTQN